jgi:DNA-binding MarR family transcriptional regulator
LENNKDLYYDEIVDKWISMDESEELVNKRFKSLNKKSEILYNFVIAYTNYMNEKRDYGTGEELSMTEAHILTDIVDYEGITVTELSKKWKKTRSAISQTIKSLLKKEYIYRVNSKDDAKFFYLYPYDKAKDFALAHKRYDNVDIVKTNKSLLEKFTVDDLVTFDNILEEYTSILLEGEEKKRKKK